MKESDSSSERAPDPSPDARRPYTTPSLVEYGSIAKLTQSGGHTATEFGNPKKKVCL
jgi:hypothetical protein